MNPTHIMIEKKDNTQLSKNFTASEMHCKCKNDTCVVTPISIELVDILQDLRNTLGASVQITSGYRCPEHNKSVKGAKNSQHVHGTAADIKIAGKTPKEVYDYLDKKYPSSLGLGLYKTWVHVDTRTTKVRWSK